MKLTRKKLLENFDEEVHEKLRVNLKESTKYLNKYDNWLWELSKYALQQHANFLPEEAAFHLKNNPFSSNFIPLGLYRMGRHVEDGHVFRIGHPLAQHILNNAGKKELPYAEIAFDYSSHPLKISILEPLVGTSGYLSLTRLSVKSFEEEDHLIFSAITDIGNILDDEQAQRLFSLPGTCRKRNSVIPCIEQLQQISEVGKGRIIEVISARNSVFFDDEMEKLEKWADDLKSGLELELKELDREIKTLKTESKKLLKLEEKLMAQKDIKDLEKRRNNKRRTLFEAQDEIDNRKEGLIEGVEARLRQLISTSMLFAIRWRVE
jgi:adenine-specific DNA-methyltransferase